MQHITAAICTLEEFAENLKLDFSAIVRKKGAIDYLPWAEIVRSLHQRVQGCTYGFKEADNGSLVHYTPDRNAYLRPYLTRYYPDHALVVESPAGFFPVSNMSARHKAMVDPDIRAIDNCLRRAIAKEIGVHTGIGLQLWASQDPYDEAEEEDLPKPSAGSRPSERGRPPTDSPNGSSPAVSRLAAASAAPAVDMAEKLVKAAEAAGLTPHGQATVAKAVSVESWVLIPPEKAPKIMQILADSDKVKLLNAGKNTQGKTINPKDPEMEVKELVEAFKAAEVDKVPF